MSVDCKHKAEILSQTVRFRSSHIHAKSAAVSLSLSWRIKVLLCGWLDGGEKINTTVNREKYSPSIITWQRDCFSSKLISSRQFIKSERRCHHSSGRRLHVSGAAATAAVRRRDSFPAQPHDDKVSSVRPGRRTTTEVVGPRNRHNRCTRSTGLASDIRRTPTPSPVLIFWSRRPRYSHTPWRVAVRRSLAFASKTSGLVSVRPVGAVFTTTAYTDGRQREGSFVGVACWTDM